MLVSKLQKQEVTGSFMIWQMEKKGTI